MKKPLYKDLFFQVVVAILLGIALGWIAPGAAVQMKPLGDAFIDLIKMMIAPVIFCTIVTGVAGMNDMKRVGRVGAKAILCFEVITTFALIIGLVLVRIARPGSDLNITAASAGGSEVEAVKEKLAHAAMPSATDFLLHIIPTSFLSPFTSGDTLQVLLVAILFAWALPALGERQKQAISCIDTLSRIFFRIMDMITRLAPVGAFGAIAYAVGKNGIGSLRSLLELLGLFYITCALFILLIMGPLLRWYCGLSVWKFLVYLKEELLIIVGTSSSESVLPRLMEKLERLGVGRSIVGMVVPAGYSFNLVGSSIYFTMGAMFIIYATHTPFSFASELWMLGILLIASKGAAGVAGSAFLIMAATLSSMNIMDQSQLSVALFYIYGIDRFMSTGRALTNLVGNGITAVVVAKWEKELDMPKARRVLESSDILTSPQD